MKNTTLRHFDKLDYDTFGGVESKYPMIGYMEGACVIVDDKHLELVNDDGDTWTMEYISAATAEAVATMILTDRHDGLPLHYIVENFSLELI